MKILAALCVCITLGLASPTWANDDPDVTATTTAGGLAAGAIKKDPLPVPHGQPILDTDPGPKVVMSGVIGCVGPELIAQSSELAVAYCTDDDAPPVITAADAQKAFGELPLEAGVLMIEPPDHVTLVNFDTNFYTTTTEPVSRPMTLLDQAVTLEATPSQYTWAFGDGQSLTTTIPGAPYPRLDVTHNYLLKGDYLPSLSTTYTGRFKVGDGPWQTIPGTVTIEGTGQPLRAITAKPKLVGY